MRDELVAIVLEHNPSPVPKRLPYKRLGRLRPCGPLKRSFEQGPRVLLSREPKVLLSDFSFSSFPVTAALPMIERQYHSWVGYGKLSDASNYQGKFGPIQYARIGLSLGSLG